MGNTIHHAFIFFSHRCFLSWLVVLSNVVSIQYLSKKYTIQAALAISINGILN
jgi:hypothetical protein